MQRYFGYMCNGTCAGGLKKKFDLRSGSQCHKHFVGFFNVPVQAPTRDRLFYGYSEKPSHLVAFYDTLGIRMTYYHLKPRGPNGDYHYIGSCGRFTPVSCIDSIVFNILADSAPSLYEGSDEALPVSSNTSADGGRRVDGRDVQGIYMRGRDGICKSLITS